MIKYNKKINKFAQVLYKDIYGLRNQKYDMLIKNKLLQIKWETLKLNEPYYFFVPKDFKGQVDYEHGFKITDLFNEYSSGIKTHRDDFLVDFNKETLNNRIKNFYSINDKNEIITLFNLKETGDWKIEEVLKKGKFDPVNSLLATYRPFDMRYLHYDLLLMNRGRYTTMRHFIHRKNIGLIVPRMCKGHRGFEHGFLSKIIVDVSVGDPFSGSGTYFFPLYLYEEKSNQLELYEKVNGTRQPNFKREPIEKIEEILNLKLVTEEKQKGKTNFSPADLLDYIYAVLYSPTYRKKYQEFLKIDFPRMPYPKDQKVFWQLVTLGLELRSLHLLESPKLNKLITKYPVGGENLVEKVSYEAQNQVKGNVYINSTQYFEDVPLIAWEFYIGGYQPAQKWLKDRKNKNLSFDDINHYQKIIVTLYETNRLMQEIDKVERI